MGLPSILRSNITDFFPSVVKNRLHVPDQGLVIPDQFVGIELEVENVPMAMTAHNPLAGWNIVGDGSLRGSTALEYTTAGAMCGEGLITAVDTFSAAAAESGCTLSQNASFRTSTHVHLDFTRSDNYVNIPRDSVHGAQQVVLLYWMLEDLFFGVAGEPRRHCGYAFPYDEASDDLRTFLQCARTERAMQSSHRYYGLNFRSLSKFGTLEFRHMPLMLDSASIMRWVRTIMRLKKWAYENLRQDLDTPAKYDLTASSDGVEEAAAYVMSEYPGSLNALNMDTVEARVEEVGIWMACQSANTAGYPYNYYQPPAGTHEDDVDNGEDHDRDMDNISWEEGEEEDASPPEVTVGRYNVSDDLVDAEMAIDRAEALQHRGRTVQWRIPISFEQASISETHRQLIDQLNIATANRGVADDPLR